MSFGLKCNILWITACRKCRNILGTSIPWSNVPRILEWRDFDAHLYPRYFDVWVKQPTQKFITKEEWNALIEPHLKRKA